MNLDRLCDFLFVGSAVVPVLLFLAGEPVLGAIAMVALLVAGAVCGIGAPSAPHQALLASPLPHHRAACPRLRASRCAKVRSFTSVRRRADRRAR